MLKSRKIAAMVYFIWSPVAITSVETSDGTSERERGRKSANVSVSTHPIFMLSALALKVPLTSYANLDLAVTSVASVCVSFLRATISVFLSIVQLELAFS